MRKLLIVLGIVVLAAAGVCYNQMPETRVNELKPPFRKVWEFNAQGRRAQDLQIMSNTVCYATDNRFGAVDLVTGKELWGKPYSNNFRGIELAGDGKLLYVAIGKRKLLACDPRTGREAWGVPSKADYTRMAVSQGTLYCQLKDGFLTALSLKTRKPIWAVNLEPVNLPKNKRTFPYTTSNILLLQGRLFVGTSAGDLVCLRARTGKRIWWYRVSGEENYPAGIVADGNRVYFSTRQNHLIALNISSGKKIWLFDTESDDWDEKPPCLLAGNVAFGAGGALNLIKSSNGSVIWSKALCRPAETRLSPPLASSGKALLTNASWLICFDASGRKTWEWDTEEDLCGDPIVPTRDGFVVGSYGTIYRFAMGEPPKLPDTPEARLGLAKTLVARLDSLTKDELRTLCKLGDEAFVTLLPVVRERMKAYEAKEAEAARKGGPCDYDAFNRLDKQISALARTASKKRTPEMIALAQEAKTRDVRSSFLWWLVERGDEEQTIPFFLGYLKRQKKADLEMDVDFSAALQAIVCTSSPQAIGFLIEKLADPNADPAIRQAAFQNLARTGGDAGVRAVTAARDTRRDIPSLYDFMGMDKLSPTVKKKFDEYQWPWATLAELVETGRDSSGTLWGLISCGAVGLNGDLWIARRDGDKWGAPIFTGVTMKELSGRNWVKLFCGNTALTKDSDKDGWTDLVERRIGSDPTKADTDDDGLADSKDMNPLAAPHRLTEAQKILSAAFQARFQFGGGRDTVCVVQLPEGVEPFELTCWGWITICVREGTKSPWHKRVTKGIGFVDFDLPRYGFDGRSAFNRDKKDVFILWNDDYTEAKLQLSTTYGGRDATGFDIRLKKFGDQWLVVGMEMTLIS